MNLYFRTLLVCVVALALLSSFAFAADSEHPLEPIDLSSPRATLTSFLESGDKFSALLRNRLWHVPSRAGAEEAKRLRDVGARMFDLSEIPPGARSELVRDGIYYLYDVLSRIELPPLTEVPDSVAYEGEEAGDPIATKPVFWRIPHTEITLVRLTDGPRAGDFVFSSDTLKRAHEFYEMVRDMPYRRDVPLKNYPEKRQYLSLRTWYISSATIESFPAWLKQDVLDQALWKWFGLVILFGSGVLAAVVIHRFAQHRLFRRSWSVPLHRLVAPLALLLIPLALDQANFHLTLTGWVSGLVSLVAQGIAYIALAWIVWVALTALAEAIIASPKIQEKSLDAHLLRLVARSIGILAVIGTLAYVSNELGAPVYSLVAGLGVGGLALALAIRPTLENIIGSLTLFADKPVRVGDFCRFGDEYGTVEEIGLRSTRLRKWDDTLVTVPNSDFAQRELFNLGKRRSRLYEVTLSLRYETSPQQLRYVLAKIREMLIGHPKVSPDWLSVRFDGFGAYSLDIQIYAYIRTREWLNYGAIREDINFRIMDIVKEAGTAFAFPSQTTYFGRDSGLDSGRGKDAETTVEEWRSKGQLPFPNFDEETLKEKQDKLDYPPFGSPNYKPEK